MTLSERLREYISACFTGIWIESHEHNDALTELARLCQAEQWRLLTWDIERGLATPAGNAGATAQDPLSALRAFGALPSGESQSSILVLQNFHRFLQSAEVVQTLTRLVVAGKVDRRFVVILAPVVAIPVELEKLFVVVEHDLPGRQQLVEIAQGVATQPGELPEGQGLDRVLDAAAGLTRHEAEGAFSLSIVRHERVTPETIWELKSQMLKKSGLISLHQGAETFADLGGLRSLKDFCMRALRPEARQNKLVRPRGVLLLSPPGCGKSAFAKALGNETGRPTLVLDIGSLMGSLVGATEQNVRKALQIADAMAPCILFCDEIEKGLSGVASSGQSDSGVTARLFGSLLTWLNDHESDVFFVGTCNDVSKLPAEFSRAERFDGVFFLDLPGVSERRAIWQLYGERFGVSVQPTPPDADWTGAEIRACCRLAALLGVSVTEAAQNVVPVARTSAETVGKLRDWAQGRCLSADRPGIYSREEQAPKTGRRVSRPSSN